MKRLLFILALVIIANHSWAQSNRHQISDVPDTVRYQIVQSEEGVRYTFMIDKYNGEVGQLVKGKNGIAWQYIPLNDYLQDKEKLDRVNYQLFLSGIGARYMFLLNVHTGLTWQLTEDTDTGELFWQVFY